MPLLTNTSGGQRPIPLFAGSLTGKAREAYSDLPSDTSLQGFKSGLIEAFLYGNGRLSALIPRGEKAQGRNICPVWAAPDSYTRQLGISVRNKPKGPCPFGKTGDHSVRGPSHSHTRGKPKTFAKATEIAEIYADARRETRTGASLAGIFHRNKFVPQIEDCPHELLSDNSLQGIRILLGCQDHAMQG